MNKAKYLTLVYLLPIILYPLEVDHFQGIWIWYYIPFAIFFGTYVWFKPTENITKYIILTPLAFLVFFITAFSVQVSFSQGLNAALEFIPVILLFAAQIGLVAGVIYVLLALLILKGLVKLGLELNNS